MVDEKNEGQRRVYVLPTELHNRLVLFQNEKGIASEAEAVRKLLDGALKARDTADDILRRVKNYLAETSETRDAARDLLVGHPLITKLEFNGDVIVVGIKGRSDFQVHPDGTIFTTEGFGSEWSVYDLDIPF
ncbi:MAG: hypothetical protein JJ979_25595 [Roseibium sp.]|nr:hypothetical protein [Roseibium sp.]